MVSRRKWQQCWEADTFLEAQLDQAKNKQPWLPASYVFLLRFWILEELKDKQEIVFIYKLLSLLSSTIKSVWSSQT